MADVAALHVKLHGKTIGSLTHVVQLYRRTVTNENRPTNSPISLPRQAFPKNRCMIQPGKRLCVSMRFGTPRKNIYRTTRASSK